MTNILPRVKKDIFLEAYAKCGNVSRAATLSDIDRGQHYRWMLSDPKYAVAFEMAQEQAIELLEAEVRRRGLEGDKKYKFDKAGKPIKHPRTGEPYYERQYSDTLLIFLLKSLKPGVYRDRVEHTGPDGGPITIEHLAPQLRKPDED